MPRLHQAMLVLQIQVTIKSSVFRVAFVEFIGPVVMEFGANICLSNTGYVCYQPLCK